MKISYRWLIELTGLDWSVEEMAERFCLSGLNCEDIEPTDKHLKNVIVGQVVTLEEVPGASKIRKATVDTGAEHITVICGAPNVAVGQKIALAQVGAELANGMKIAKATIRGVESSGMICSESELGISNDHAGIMVLDRSATVGKPLSEQLGLNDYVMNLEITPNRGDALSAIGMARDLAALGGVKIRRPEIRFVETKEKTADQISVRSDDPVGCPRFTARIVRNVKIGPSPWWLQKKLLAAGVRPISNVVDITNLVLLETGCPLHAFDLDRFGSKQVVVRRAKGGEKFTTLDGNEHTLTSEVLLVTNGERAVGAAGVMGGLESEVADDTKNVLLEVAYFKPGVIRRGRRELGLNTEASYRFERGVDPNGVERASARAVALMAELCGGEVQADVVDWYPTPIAPKVVTLRPTRCRAILGADVPTAKMKEILANLEFKVEGDDPLRVTVPTFRSDVELEIDLIEEIVRIIGYNQIPDSLEAKGPLCTPTHVRDTFADKLRQIMTGCGFDEILGHGLADSRLAEAVNPGMPQIRILNPISEDLNIMRNSLIVTALTTVNHNLSHRNTDLSLFEIGAAYFPPDAQHNWLEEDRLSIAVTGNTQASWRDHPRSVDFYDLKGALDNLFWRLGFVPGNGVQYRATVRPYFDKGQSFELVANETVCGAAGLVTPEILKKFEIKQSVYLAELVIPRLISSRQLLTQFKPLPVYPSAPRDLALIVDETVKVGQIIAGVKSVAGPLAESVAIFDLYKGKPIPQGRKSVGITIVYRSAERSLSGDEVEAVQQKVIAHLKSSFKAELREQ